VLQCSKSLFSPKPSLCLTYSPPSSPSLQLDHGEDVTYSRAGQGGEFEFQNIPLGVHSISVVGEANGFSSEAVKKKEDDFVFPFVKVLVTENADGVVVGKCHMYYFLGGERVPLPSCNNLRLPAISKVSYFEQKRPFSLMGLFKNPMLLMMLFGAGMTFIMPKMMEGMDPEQRKEMEAQMAAQQDPMKMMQNLFGGGGDDEGETAPKAKKLGNNKKNR